MIVYFVMTLENAVHAKEQEKLLEEPEVFHVENVEEAGNVICAEENPQNPAVPHLDPVREDLDNAHRDLELNPAEDQVLVLDLHEQVQVGLILQEILDHLKGPQLLNKKRMLGKKPSELLGKELIY